MEGKDKTVRTRGKRQLWAERERGGYGDVKGLKNINCGGKKGWSQRSHGLGGYLGGWRGVGERFIALPATQPLQSLRP